MFSSAVIGNLLGEFHAMSYTQVYYLSKPKKRNSGGLSSLLLLEEPDGDGGVGSHGSRQGHSVVREESSETVEKGIAVVGGVTGGGGGAGDTGHP